MTNERNTEQLPVKRLSAGYRHPILQDMDFTIKGGEKVVITGFNGIGRSTLLKTLSGQVPPLKGSFRFSEQVRREYFEQDMVWPESTKTPVQIHLFLQQIFLTDKHCSLRFCIRVNPLHPGIIKILIHHLFPPVHRL